MPNPVTAFPNTYCDNCSSLIPEDEDVYFHDSEKLCIECAEEAKVVCECGSYKKPDFPTCYECHTK